MLSLSEKQVLFQLFVSGATRDDALFSKEGRDGLVDFKLAVKYEDWTILTVEGLKRALSLGMGEGHRQNV